MEFALIAHLLSRHPVVLTFEETVRELADSSISGADPTGVDDAIRGLIRSGLLRSDGTCVVPTAPALRLAGLWGHP